MTGSQLWRLESKCRTLSPEAADKLFFPGRGGKVNKAEIFCSSCPVIQSCLVDAIENDLEGFYAGSTQQSRRIMAKFRNININPIVLLNEPSKKPKKIKQRRPRRVAVSKPYSWLDAIIGPSEDDLKAI